MLEPREAFLKAMQKAKEKQANQNASNNVVFARKLTTPLLKCHGMEIAIGKLTFDELDELKTLLLASKYFDSAFVLEFHKFSNEYHADGILVSDLGSLSDFDNLTKGVFEFDENDESNFNNITIPEKGFYLCSFRNATKGFVAKGIFPLDKKVNIVAHVDQITFLDDLEIDINLLINVSCDDEYLERDDMAEEGSGEIFDLVQFIIVDGKVVCCITNNTNDSIQYPFDELPIEELNKIIPVIHEGKKVKKELLWD